MYLIEYVSLSSPLLATLFTWKWLGNVDYTVISTSFPLINFPYFYHLTHIFTRTLNTLIPIIKGSQIVKSNGHFSTDTIFRVLGACFPGDIHLLLNIVSLHLVDINFPGFSLTSLSALFLLSRFASSLLILVSAAPQGFCLRFSLFYFFLLGNLIHSYSLIHICQHQSTLCTQSQTSFQTARDLYQAVSWHHHWKVT